MREFQRVSDVFCQITVSQPAGRALEYGYPRNSVVVDFVTDRAQLAQRYDAGGLWSLHVGRIVGFGGIALLVHLPVTSTKSGSVGPGGSRNAWASGPEVIKFFLHSSADLALCREW
jgi:hypothetical protein